jgi:hypothetical protein
MSCTFNASCNQTMGGANEMKVIASMHYHKSCSASAQNELLEKRAVREMNLDMLQLNVACYTVSF